MVLSNFRCRHGPQESGILFLFLTTRKGWGLSGDAPLEDCAEDIVAAGIMATALQVMRLNRRNQMGRLPLFLDALD